MEHVIPDIWLAILSGLKITTLAIGATFVVYAARAWVKHRARPMLLLAIAVAILTGGIFTEGVIFWLTGSMNAAHITESAIALIGFSVLLSSVITAKKGRVRRVAVEAESGKGEGE